MSTHEYRTGATAHSGALWRIASTRIPTKWGMFDAIGFERDIWNGGRKTKTALALVMGDPSKGAPPLRIHSQCVTGEVLGSLRCDCRDRGLVIYEHQEGRGIGLMAKLGAYELQDVADDTVEANHALGFKADLRDFSLPAAIARHFAIKKVRLLSNDSRKAKALTEKGIDVVAQLACKAVPNPRSLVYLQAKNQKMGHALVLDGTERTSSPSANGALNHSGVFLADAGHPQ
jgi:GTP cyclohydrolase II